MNRFLISFGKNVDEKVSNQTYFIFHLI